MALDAPIEFLSVSDDGKTIAATGTRYDENSVAEASQSAVWQDGELIVLPGKRIEAMSPSGHTIAVGFDDDTLEIVADGKRTSLVPPARAAWVELPERRCGGHDEWRRPVHPRRGGRFEQPRPRRSPWACRGSAAPSPRTAPGSPTSARVSRMRSGTWPARSRGRPATRDSLGTPATPGFPILPSATTEPAWLPPPRARSSSATSNPRMSSRRATPNCGAPARNPTPCASCPTTSS